VVGFVAERVILYITKSLTTSFVLSQLTVIIERLPLIELQIVATVEDIARLMMKFAMSAFLIIFPLFEKPTPSDV
jgi:hypothetical protein